MGGSRAQCGVILEGKDSSLNVDVLLETALRLLLDGSGRLVGFGGIVHGLSVEVEARDVRGCVTERVRCIWPTE